MADVHALATPKDTSPPLYATSDLYSPLLEDALTRYATIRETPCPGQLLCVRVF